MGKKPKPRVAIQVTGKTIAYEQSIGKGGKLGKARPVLITTARVLGSGATAPPAKKTRKRRR